MRVLILNWKDMKSREAGGAEFVVDNVAKGLSKLGHDVTIFNSNCRECGGEEEKRPHARIIRRGSIYTVYVHAFLYYLRHRKDFDVIIESINTVPFFTPIYARNKRIIALPHHFMGLTVFRELKFPTSIIAYGVEKLIPALYRYTDVVVVSKHMKEGVIRKGLDPGKITVCYFGLPNGFKPVQLSKYEEPTLIAVTRLRRYKRVDLLLDVFKQINYKIPSRLLVLGEGIDKQRLQDYASKLGLSDRVRFTGWVSEDEKAEMLARSWVFLTASEREGFGISVLEAEACGTPAVAFNNGGLSDAIKDRYSGFLVKEGDIKAYKEAVELLLQDPKLRGRMSANSVEYSNTFKPELAVKKMDAIIRSTSEPDVAAKA